MWVPCYIMIHLPADGYLWWFLLCWARFHGFRMANLTVRKFTKIYGSGGWVSVWGAALIYLGDTFICEFRAIEWFCKCLIYPELITILLLLFAHNHSLEICFCCGSGLWNSHENRTVDLQVSFRLCLFSSLFLFLETSLLHRGILHLSRAIVGFLCVFRQ